MESFDCVLAGVLEISGEVLTNAIVIIQSSTPHDLRVTLQYTRKPKVNRAKTVNIIVLPAKDGALSA
jgi:hypothetical protein